MGVSDGRKSGNKERERERRREREREIEASCYEIELVSKRYLRTNSLDSLARLRLRLTLKIVIGEIRFNVRVKLQE